MEAACAGLVPVGWAVWGAVFGELLGSPSSDLPPRNAQGNSALECEPTDWRGQGPAVPAGSMGLHLTLSSSALASPGGSILP